MTTAEARSQVQPKRFSDDDARKIRVEHERGDTLNALRKRYQTTRKTIEKTITRAGGKPNARPKPESMRERRYPGVWAVARGKNRKLGDCSTTAVAEQSCPESCPFRGQGCYASYDQVSLGWDRISKVGKGMTPLELAQMESEAIRSLPARRPLRLHVAGDSTTREGTRLIADACADYVARGKREGEELATWSYTHASDQVERSDWGTVSVLASCETPADVRRAWERGYAAAITVTQFASARAYTLGEGADSIRVIPCPAQTRGRTCSECKLCHDDQRLLDAKLVIAFEVHGSGKRKAAETISRRLSLPTIQVAEAYPQ